VAGILGANGAGKTPPPPNIKQILLAEAMNQMKNEDEDNPNPVNDLVDKINTGSLKFR